ncbi:hypothetical protein BGZ70_003700, partial [Mortierella alpina]
MRLKKVFNEESVNIGGTWVSRPRENCHSCGKREEFIDDVYTAAKGGVHDVTFMKKVLTGEIPAIGQGVVHQVECSHCKTPARNPRHWRGGDHWREGEKW